MGKTCTVAGCAGPVVARGWCKKHYARWERTGSLAANEPLPRSGTCEAPGCTRPIEKRRLCSLHYQRQRRTGSTVDRRPSVEQRFWTCTDKAGADACWLWTGKLDHTGYGVFTIGRKGYRAHRVAYEMFVGPIPSGLVIDHDCHNRAAWCKGGGPCDHRKCVNPAHLVPRTQRDNLYASPNFLGNRRKEP